MKEIVVGVVVAVVVSAIFYFGGKVDAGTADIFIPKNAVIAFDSDSCPLVGWEEYRPAYGRFMRGIDKSKQDIDPDGQRRPGSLQDDEFEEHVHSTSAGRITLGNSDGGRGRPEQTEPLETGSKGGVETRPKNVALLYCEKT